MSAYAYARLGDITADQFRALASHPAGPRRRGPGHQPPERRVPRPEREPAARLHQRLAAIGMAEPGAELARDVVACPGADTCNLAVTQSRGWPTTSARPSRRPAWPTSAASASTSPAAPTAAASTTSPTSGSSAPSAGPTASPPPGYQMLLGGHVGQTEIEFGEKALRLPAKARARGDRAGGRALRRRAPGRRDLPRLARPRPAGSAASPRLKDLDEWPTPEERPDYYVDFGETGPYVAEIGAASARPDRTTVTDAATTVIPRGCSHCRLTTRSWPSSTPLRAPPAVDDHPLGGRQRSTPTSA